ncbi:MAG TPA: hypothetical protein DIT48_06640, partial [Actinobacteria bacterium]|nr:hypothetical protein [Actinomycetota bacterium]
MLADMGRTGTRAALGLLTGVTAVAVWLGPVSAAGATGGPHARPAGVSLHQRIVFDSDRSGTRQLYEVNAHGNGIKRLTFTGENVDPAWSADGTRIVFASNRGGTFGVYTIQADGSSVNLVTASSGFDGTPAWSPDGKWIA